MKVGFCLFAVLLGASLCSGRSDAGIFRSRSARQRPAFELCRPAARILCRRPSRRPCDAADPVVAAVALGDSLRAKKDWDAAIAAYTNAVQLAPKCAKAYYGRGRAYANKDDLDKAKADWNEAIRLDPKYADPHTSLGLMYGLKGNLEKALAECFEGYPP